MEMILMLQYISSMGFPLPSGTPYYSIYQVSCILFLTQCLTHNTVGTQILAELNCTWKMQRIKMTNTWSPINPII